MTHRLFTNYAKNYCTRTLIVKVIVENVVTCFLGHGVVNSINSVHCISIVSHCNVAHYVIQLTRCTEHLVLHIYSSQTEHMA